LRRRAGRPQLKPDPLGGHGMSFHAPLEDVALRSAQPHFDRLNGLANEVAKLGEHFWPIYTYYFPQSWFTVIARLLRLKPMPDFAKYRSELQRFRDDAWRIATEAKMSGEAILRAGVSKPFQDAARLCFDFVHADATIIVLFHNYVKAMDEMDAETADQSLGAMREFSRRSRESRKKIGSVQRALPQV